MLRSRSSVLILKVSGLHAGHLGESPALGRGTVRGRNATLRLGVWRGDADADPKVMTAASKLLPGVKYSVNSSIHEAVGSYTVVGPHDDEDDDDDVDDDGGDDEYGDDGDDDDADDDDDDDDAHRLINNNYTAKTKAVLVPPTRHCWRDRIHLAQKLRFCTVHVQCTYSARYSAR